MTITIDIPAVQALANAINNLAESQRGTQVHLASGTVVHPGTEDNRAIPVTAEGQVIEPKRTRRTKAEMEAERKAIEEQKGRRVDLTTTSTEGGSIQQNVITDQPDPTPFQWTLEQLKDTFIAPITDNDLRSELIAIRQEVDPQAPTLAKVDPQHYPELAKRFTAWFNDKGLDLQLPEGAE